MLTANNKNNNKTTNLAKTTRKHSQCKQTMQQYTPFNNYYH